MGDDVLDIVPTTESEADELLAAIDAPTKETALTPAPEVQAHSTPEEPPAAKDPFDFEDEINWRGENRKLHYSKIKQFAQQGFDYSEKNREFNQTRATFEAEKTQWQKTREDSQKQIDAYRAVDEWAKHNPSLWAKVQEEFQRAGASGEAPQIAPALKAKLDKLENFVESVQAEKAARQKAEEDTTLDNEIQHFRQQHPEIDWNQTKEFKTPDGVRQYSLENQICQYMVDNKIGSFRAAARDYLWDQFQKKTELRAKEEVGKTIQKNTKFGGKVVSKTQSSKPGSNGANPAQFSYDELANQALAEFGLS